MDREILFRGKRMDNGEWVDGFISGLHMYDTDDKTGDITHIYSYYMNRVHPVIASTVGQYTGLTDKNGKKIFEGDIAKYNTIAKNEKIVYGVIRYRNTYEQYRSHNPCGYIIDWQKNNSTGRTLREDLPFWCDSISNMEVIGNIHDNPELLEVAEC